MATGGSVGEGEAARLSVAVDIGGTFTDLVAFDERSGRVYQAKSLITPREAEAFVHGSTVAINIAIEETGAKTALVVTKGTRDVYKIGRLNRPEAYNFFFKRPVPLVPRSRTFEVNERFAAWGEVLTPLDPADADAVAR